MPALLHRREENAEPTMSKPSSREETEIFEEEGGSLEGAADDDQRTEEQMRELYGYENTGVGDSSSPDTTSEKKDGARQKVGFSEHVESFGFDSSSDDDEESLQEIPPRHPPSRRHLNAQRKAQSFMHTRRLSSRRRQIVRQVSQQEPREANAWWPRRLSNLVQGGGGSESFHLSRRESRMSDVEPSESRRSSMPTMSSNNRIHHEHSRLEAIARLARPSSFFRSNRHNDPSESEHSVVKQYRVVSSSTNKSRFDRYYVRETNAFNWINLYMAWTFHASFVEVTLASYSFFMVLTIIFSLIIYWISYKQPECIVVGDKALSEAINFVDAIHLSWTLSTVGYGIIGPGLASFGSGTCAGINLLMAFESFVGVCFASVTGAVIFAKVARIQSSAPVVFSDPIVVRFGEGCLDIPFDEGDHSTTVFDLSTELPCPVLEFRILNSMWNMSEGEIMNATVNLVASRLEAPDEEDRRLELHRRQQKRNDSNGKIRLPMKSEPGIKLVAESAVSTDTGSFFQRVNKSVIKDSVKADQAGIPATDDGPSGEDKPYSSVKRIPQTRRSSIAAVLQHQMDHVSPEAVAAAGVTVDEGSAAPKQVYTKLFVETDSHPFFKRTWNIRHVCNEHSPLLPVRVRRKIRKNRGFWPEELNDHESIRKAINFHEIVVSFSGIANASGCAVYTQKVYSYVDMAVGYSFVNLFGKDKKTSKIIVDAELLNDVREQDGGGAEPITGKDDPIFEGYLPNALADAVVEGSVSEDLAKQVKEVKKPATTPTKPKRKRRRHRVYG